MDDHDKRYAVLTISVMIPCACGMIVLMAGAPYLVALQSALDHAGLKVLLIALAVWAIVATAGIMAFSYTHAGGWLLLGVVAPPGGITAFLISERFRPQFWFENEPFKTGGLWWGVGILVATLAILSAIETKCLAAIRGVAEEQAKRAAADKEAMEKAMKSLSTNIAATNETHATAIQKSEAKSKVEREAHRETKLLRPFESQLMAAHAISLAVQWMKADPSGAFALEALNGNQDKNFGDFIGKTRGLCWINELKRDWGCVKTERKKHARQKQARALRDRKDMEALAEKCHWMGWGEVKRKEASLRFSPYWSTYYYDDPPIANVTNHEFAQCAFGQGLWRVGIPPDDFARYMYFLAEESGNRDAEESDSIATLVFQRDEQGRVRYWIAADLHTVGQSITSEYFKRAPKIEHEFEGPTHDRGQDHGPVR